MAVLAHTEAMRRKKGQKPFRPAVCGTLGGYGRHARNGEEPCEDCKEAKSADNRKRKKPRRYWQALWLGQFGVCPLCGRPIPYESSEIHVDHIVPASKGGANDMVNLQATHKKCNLVKNNRTDQWARAKLKKQPQNQ